MIVFRTSHHADVKMFDDLAKFAINKMGASDALPSALSGELLAESCEKLRLAREQAQKTAATWGEDGVALAVRLAPLEALLAYAVASNQSVMWESTAW
ncbi:DUF1840 family protein [Thiomicrospira cyclica]|uniref:DUF1840 domain-containing protein n=1 Tax=Thiomicrospira cyclica (strain DSM 14477 / JCM 11371 / ALM1) TaxID=717773 RepID=F6DAP4_THICA|nr:DUF1840 family protein [Thiomicrospira cyclica]AEG31137.1 hypothetical protein Thicy_0361 [Thiomicrospira cyclica ALM1]